jgi:hypothetical protein
MWEKYWVTFAGSQKSVRIVYIGINGNFVLDLYIFILQRDFTEGISFVKWGMAVYRNNMLEIMRTPAEQKDVYSSLDKASDVAKPNTERCNIEN